MHNGAPVIALADVDTMEESKQEPCTLVTPTTTTCYSPVVDVVPLREATQISRTHLDFNDIVNTLDSSSQRTRDGQPSHTVRPMCVDAGAVPCIFTEPVDFKRRRHYPNTNQLDYWQPITSRKSRTRVPDLNRRSGRQFWKAHGKITRAGGLVSGLRYHKYTETDPSTDADVGTAIFLVQHAKPRRPRPPSGAASASGAASPPCFYQAPLGVTQSDTAQAYGSKAQPPLLNLSTNSQGHSKHAEFINFEMNGKSLGNITSTPVGGIVMTSTSGDFAEWHEMAEKSDASPSEGSIVGFHEGKVDLTTLNARILGVITARPVVLGSLPDCAQGHEGAMVAYCGRVPIRTIGPVKAGDVLVASGRNDGLAQVAYGADASASSCDGSACTTLGAKVHIQPSIGVAIQSYPQQGEVLVEATVTPPSMTRDVISQLHGKPRMQATSGRILRMLILLVAALCGVFACVSGSPSWAAGGAASHIQNGAKKNPSEFETPSAILQPQVHGRQSDFSTLGKVQPNWTTIQEPPPVNKSLGLLRHHQAQRSTEGHEVTKAPSSDRHTPAPTTSPTFQPTTSPTQLRSRFDLEVTLPHNAVDSTMAPSHTRSNTTAGAGAGAATTAATATAAASAGRRRPGGCKDKAAPLAGIAGLDDQTQKMTCAQFKAIYGTCDPALIVKSKNCNAGCQAYPQFIQTVCPATCGTCTATAALGAPGCPRCQAKDANPAGVHCFASQEAYFKSPMSPVVSALPVGSEQKCTARHLWAFTYTCGQMFDYTTDPNICSNYKETCSCAASSSGSASTDTGTVLS